MRTAPFIGFLIAVLAFEFVICLGWRHQAHMNALALRLVMLNGMEDGTYETCPDCGGNCGGCTRCFDDGLIPHVHD